MIATILAALVAVEHVYILVLEMFLWRTAYGRRVFGSTQAYADETAVLAKNQGLYNGFLAAGLAWGLWRGDWTVVRFFLGCVVVAGVFGGVTAKRSILWIQGLPAAVALAAALLLR